MDNFKAMYRILRYLEEAMDYDEPDMDFISADALKISENRWLSIMGMLLDKGFIAGAEIKRSMGGEAIISISSLRITLDGLHYLKENSTMAKIARTAKGVIEVVK